MTTPRKLYEFRKQIKNLDSKLSYNFRSGPNGAVIHYKPNVKTNRTLKKVIFIWSTRGQYEFGTTVTRTISLNIPIKNKNIFTRS